MILQFIVGETLANPRGNGKKGHFSQGSTRGFTSRQFGHHSSYAAEDEDPLFSILKLIFFVIVTFLIVMAITKCVEHNCCNPESSDEEVEDDDDTDDDEQ